VLRDIRPGYTQFGVVMSSLFEAAMARNSCVFQHTPLDFRGNRLALKKRRAIAALD